MFVPGRQRTVFSLSAVALALATLTLPLLAQTTSTEILGLVTDASGAVVPGAKVTILRLATGETRTAVTNQAGDYSFPLIEIGEYNIRCEMQGFRSQTISGLRVQTQQKARVNFTLALGEISETVEVTAVAVSLKTEDVTVGQVIDNKRVIELPLNGRNLSHLAVLVAGVQFGRRTGMADGQGGFPIPGAAVSIIANGIRETYGTVALDGVDAKNPRTHTTVFTPSIEAVEEFKVQTSSYSAEFGQGGGGIIQISMKSGTNQLRGTLFEFLRNDKLDAESYFLNFERPAGQGRLPKDRLRRNQFGAIVSGPVVLPGYNGRNRTFWAFDYEGRRDTTERVQTAFFPNDDFRNGNFSALLNPANNPATGRPFRAPIVVFDPLTGDPFPGNVIPQARIHAGARNLLKFIPPAQFQQADILDFTARASVPDTIEQNQYFWRADHIFSDYDKVFVRYAGDRSTFSQDYVNPNFPIHYTSSGTNLASQWIHTFNPRMLNEFRFGFNIANDDIANPRTNSDFDIDSLNIGRFRIVNDGNRQLTQRETGIPLITQFTIGDRDTGNGYDRQLALQFANNLSLNRDTHNFKMGVEYRRAAMTRGAANEPRGSMTFSANESGYALASFLMGYPATARSPESLHEHQPRTNRWGIYFLDDWKATSRLTINLGLRWDYFGTPVDRLGGFRSLSFGNTYRTPDGADIPTIIPVEIDRRGAVKLWNQEYRYFMPRIGFAYRPLNKWVIRSGIGWFSNVEHMNTYSILSNMPPFGGSQQFSAVTDAAGATRRFRAGSPIVSFDDPFGGSAAVRPLNLLAIQPDHRNPNHWQWSLDIQRELPWSTALTVGYVGSKSTNVGDSLVNWNSPDPSPDTNFQRRRPYQRFYDLGQIQDLGQLRFIRSDENGFYHGLQTTVEKRYSNGLVYGLSYTFSKAHGDGESNGNNPADFPNPRDRRGARGRYLFDQRHSGVFHFVYELPFGGGLHGVAGGLLKGWQVNGVLSLRSGFPFTISQGADLNLDNSPVRPDRISDGRLLDAATRQRWFDTSAFRRVTCNIPARPDLCRYGNAGRAILESPGQRNLDFSVFKNFQIHESWKLQFRSEFFNFTNTPYFNQPNGVTFSTLNSVVADGPRDGEIRSIRSPMRIIQFGLKLFF